MFDNTLTADVPLPWTTPQDLERVAAYWSNLAALLTDWAWANLVVRTDAYGRYRSDAELAMFPNRERTTIEKRQLHRLNVRRHFTPLDRSHILGPLTTDLDNISRAVTWDIDLHDEGQGDPIANCRFALELYERMRRMGYRPLLTDSNGRGGFHLRLVSMFPHAAGVLRSFGLWLMRDWKDWVAKEPEVFPKQNVLTGKMLGNWVRLPGKHHTRNHWSRIWTGEEWDDSPLHILNAVGNQFSMPEEAWFFSGKASTIGDRTNIQLPQTAPVDPSPDIKDIDFTLALVRDALKVYKNQDLDYDAWFRTGASLTCLGVEGLVIWLEWSATSYKHDEEYCIKKWQSLSPEGRGLGALFHDAEKAGWNRAERLRIIGRKVRDRQAKEKVKEAMEATRKRSSK